MKKHFILIIAFIGLFAVPQEFYAQVDFNQRPDDDLGNLEDKFQEHFFEALKQKGIENYQRAIDELLICEKLDKSQSVVYYELGKNYNKLKNFGAAESALKKAISKAPSNEWYLDELYEVYNLQGNTDKAIKTVKQLVKYHRDYRQDLASLYIKAKDYKAALKILNSLDKEYGINADRDYLRNQIYDITGNDEDRIENLQKRLKEQPGNEDVHLRLIYRYSELGDTSKAFQAAKDLLKSVPDSKLVHLALYKFHLQNNEVDQAITSIKTVLDAPQINADAKAKVFQDFVLFVKQNPEYEKDLIDITAAVDTDKSVATLIELARYQLSIPDLSKALMYYEEALKQEPHNFLVLKATLKLHMELGMFNKAEECSKKAIDIFPAQPYFYLMNATSHNHLNAGKKALKSLENGLDYLVDDTAMEAEFYEQFSQAYKLLNNNTKAQAFAKKAADLKSK